MKPRSYAEIPAIPPEWAWVGRIPRKTAIILVGDEGIGKGFLGADWVARITRGDEWPDGTEGMPAGNVIMITPEDDPNSAMAYRLRAAGADLTRVFDFTEGYLAGQSIERLIEQIGGVSLIWIDPLSAVTRTPLTSSNTRVRQEVLAPLESLARKYDASLVAVVHTTKAGRTSGSKAITEAARMVLKVTRHRAEPAVRKIHVEKSNISDDGLADIAYTIFGRWPDVRVEYFEVPDDAIADDTRPTPLRAKIVALLQGSEPMEPRAIWLKLVEGDPELGIEGDPTLKYGAVRTALTRLGRDPFSGVHGDGNGHWQGARDDGPIIGLPPLRSRPDVPSDNR